MSKIENSHIGKVTHQGKWKVYDGLEIECYVTDAKIGLNRTTMQELDRTQKRSLTGQ